MEHEIMSHNIYLCTEAANKSVTANAFCKENAKQVST